MRNRTALLSVLAALAAMGPLAAQHPPPACTGTPMFFDVDNSDEFCPWIEQLARDGVVGSCALGRYCPDAPVTRAQLAMLLAKGMREHLWGEGRPGTTIHGDSAVTLCDDGEGPRYGLSGQEVEWSDAAAACPAGTWVCTYEERGTEACNTGREDSECDGLNCQAGCLDFTEGAHQGWVADLYGPGSGGMVTEQGVLQTGMYFCYRLPVWCCRE